MNRNSSPPPPSLFGGSEYVGVCTVAHLKSLALKREEKTVVGKLASSTACVFLRTPEIAIEVPLSCTIHRHCCCCHNLHCVLHARPPNYLGSAKNRKGSGSFFLQLRNSGNETAFCCHPRLKTRSGPFIIIIAQLVPSWSSTKYARGAVQFACRVPISEVGGGGKNPGGEAVKWLHVCFTTSSSFVGLDALCDVWRDSHLFSLPTPLLGLCTAM